MYKLSDESELMYILKSDIKNTRKNNFLFFAGHLPLLYIDNGPGKREIIVDTKRWGVFSNYSLELSCKLLKFAKKIGKRGKLLILVDDDCELPEKIKLINNEEKSVRRDYNWAHKPRRRFFMDSSLPSNYHIILDKYTLTKSDILKQIRNNNTISLLFSEKILKRDAQNNRETANDECSLAYKGILFNHHYFDFSRDYLISFMPGQCKGNICAGVLDKINYLDCSHIFFPSVVGMGEYKNEERGETPDRFISTEKLYSRGKIRYRKDSSQL